MKRFEFRLQSVKKIKESEFDKALQNVKIQEGILHKEREKLRSLHEKKQEIRRQECEFMRLFQVDLMIHCRKYLDGLQWEISEQDLRVQDALIELRKREQKMKEAMKQKKIFENLEEKAKAEYRKERLDWEQKAFDDFALIGKGRDSNG